MFFFFIFINEIIFNYVLFRPIIKLLNQLLMIDIFSEHDVNLFMTLLDPHRFSTESKLKLFLKSI